MADFSWFAAWQRIPMVNLDGLFATRRCKPKL
jgi:hypothetical protein